MTGETIEGTAGTWRTLDEALCAVQRAERRHGYESAHDQRAYAAYVRALGAHQTTATQQAACAVRQAG